MVTPPTESRPHKHIGLFANCPAFHHPGIDFSNSLVQMTILQDTSTNQEKGVYLHPVPVNRYTLGKTADSLGTPDADMSTIVAELVGFDAEQVGYDLPQLNVPQEHWGFPLAPGSTPDDGKQLIEEVCGKCDERFGCKPFLLLVSGKLPVIGLSNHHTPPYGAPEPDPVEVAAERAAYLQQPFTYNVKDLPQR